MPRGNQPQLRVDVPPDLWALIALARYVTGEHQGEFIRRVLRRGAERELFRRPGAFLWLRPGSRVWAPHLSPPPDEGGPARLELTLLANAAGGERVWPIQRVEGFPEGLAPEGEKKPLYRVGYLCDLSAEAGHDSGLNLRRVVVALGDVLPRHPGRCGGAYRRSKTFNPVPAEHLPLPGARHPRDR